VFSKTEYWDQLPSLSSESKREASHGALFAPGLSLWIFSRDTLFCLYNEVSYPGRTGSLPPWLPTPSERNVTNAPENIVRMKRGKVVTHYRISPTTFITAALARPT
jgi:hypothetical protein